MRPGLDHGPNDGNPTMKALKTLPLLIAGSLASPWVSASDDAFGRLFHTPAERQRLDQPRVEAHPAPVVTETIETHPVRLDGIVQRNGGVTAVWVDGKAVERNRAVASADGRSATVSLPDGRQMLLLVGESVQPDGAR